MSLDDRPRQAEHVLTQEAGGTLVLFHLEAGHHFSLDEVAKRIWELCDGTRSVAQIVEVMAREYDAPTDVLRADTLELLVQLGENDLLADSSAPSSAPTS
jgi:hypothetical protein